MERLYQPAPNSDNQNSGSNSSNNGGSANGGNQQTPSNEEPFELKQRNTSFVLVYTGDKLSLTSKEQGKIPDFTDADYNTISQSNPNIKYLIDYDNIYVLEHTTPDGISGLLLFGPTDGDRGASYARYALVEVGVETTDAKGYSGQLLYFGKDTETMPTSGKVTYLGKAIASNPEAAVQVRNNSIATNTTAVVEHYFGDSKFEADFDSKKLTGTLDNWKTSSDMPAMKAVNIEADIRANTFQGTANSTGYAEGKFYGPDAANIAGSFDDKDQKLFGVFGANKQ
ncbi:MAG: transferrin-binding protein-like solute binding protein [Cardiobacteriaceae bacterium]|nr:transferrin-binding protein-like solute binding protein [Cardiobacteriaceae bacterium]